jgi:hypothetical protein
MTTNHWELTLGQESEYKKLEIDQQTDYCFAREWGLSHEDAITVANDLTYKLRDELMERVFG